MSACNLFTSFPEIQNQDPTKRDCSFEIHQVFSQFETATTTPTPAYKRSKKMKLNVLSFVTITTVWVSSCVAFTDAGSSMDNKEKHIPPKRNLRKIPGPGLPPPPVNPPPVNPPPIDVP